MTKVFLKINQANPDHRELWHNVLARLKFHNPSLPITIIRNGSYPRLTLFFESEDRAALERIAHSTLDLAIKNKRSKVNARRQSSGSLHAKDTLDHVAEEEEVLRNQSPNWRDAPGPQQQLESEDGKEVQPSLSPQNGDPSASRYPIVTSDSPSSTDSDFVRRIAWDLHTRFDLERIPELATRLDRIHVKSQSAANPSAPSTTQPPKTIYTRKVVNGVLENPKDIWQWFKARTGAVDLPRSAEDREQAAKLRDHEAKAAIERARVKKGVDEMKREEADLKRARQEADRLTTEAA